MSRVQLKMTWPHGKPLNFPAPLPGEYSLRTYRAGDGKGYVRLMRDAGFDAWSEKELTAVLGKSLPGGIFFVEHARSKTIVATAAALHNPTDEHPFGGELGWVAVDPEHRGKGLGYAPCAAATKKFIDCGYKDVRLLTDDFRLPAIKIYLKLGWEPCYFRPDISYRWSEVYEIINRTRSRPERENHQDIARGGRNFPGRNGF